MSKRYVSGGVPRRSQHWGGPFSEVGKHELPDATVDYLLGGAPEGERNQRLAEAARQCRDSGRLSAAWIERLVARGVADGLPEHEARTTVKSCTVATEAREPCGPLYFNKIHPINHSQAAVNAAASPQPPHPSDSLYPQELQGYPGFRQWVQALFEDGEFVSISPYVEELEGPHGGVTLEKADLLERLDRKRCDISGLFSTKRGVYVRMNPMAKDGTRDTDVTSLRHVLVEFDVRGDKRLQLKVLQDSMLPIASVTDSGDQGEGKGLHALVRVNASNRSQWNERRDVIFNLLHDHGIDTKVSNPSRYTRCPSGRRGEGVQRLVRLGMGASTWEEWEAEHADAGEIDALLESARGPMDFADLEVDHSLTLLGDRFLCRGGACMFTGSTGIGKSSAAMQQDILWSLGRPAFGIAPARALKMAVLQVENDDGDLTEMARGVMDGLALSESERRQANAQCRIFTVDCSGEALLKLIRKLAQGHKGWKPDIIRLDPFQALSGLDVAGDVEGVLEFTMALTRIARREGVAFVINHHTPKVTAATLRERGLSYSSYIGAGGAQLANWARCDLLLLPTETEGTYQLIAGKRASRLGWPEGKVRYFKHGQDHIYWEACTADEVKAVSEGQGSPSKSRSKPPRSVSTYRKAKSAAEIEQRKRIQNHLLKHGEAPTFKLIREWALEIEQETGQRGYTDTAKIRQMRDEEKRALETHPDPAANPHLSPSDDLL